MSSSPRILRWGSLVAWAAAALLPVRSANGAPFAYVSTFNAYVSVIDLATGTEVTSIPTGGGESYWLAASGDGYVVAASLHDTTGVEIFDALTHTSLGTVGGVGSEPEAVAVTWAGGTVYVADESGDALYGVDVASMTVTEGPIDLSADCDGVENMVISPDDRYLYLTCEDGGTVIRVATADHAITTIDANNGEHGIVLNSTGSRLYYGSGSTVIEYDTNLGMPTGTTFTGCQMYNGALDPADARLFCVDEGDNLKVYRTSDGMELADVDLGQSSATGVRVHPNGMFAYVAVDNGGGSLIGSLVEVDPDAKQVTDVFGVTGVGATFPRARGVVIVPGAMATTSTTMTATTTTTASTTTTTLAGLPGCPTGATFTSLNCRLAALVAQVDAEGGLGKLKKRLLKAARQAKTRKEKAEQHCRAGRKKRTSRELRKAFRKMATFRRLLRSRTGRRVVVGGLQTSLLAVADPLGTDLKSLRKSVRCPADAP